MNVFEQLRDYFEGIAQTFEAQKLTSNAFPNTSDKGQSREEAFLNFLSDNLPRRCEAVRGGFIFDSSGNSSKQIDLIVTNDLTLRFKYFGGKSFNCVEGCYSAVSVKSVLNGKECIDSLENLASIPPMPDMTKRINPLLSKGPERFQDLPLKVVFAFDGASSETTLGHIKEFYSANTVPENRKPDLIVVNRRYAIIHIGKQGATTTDGTKVDPYSFHCVGSWDYVGAYSLMYLLVSIQKASALGSQMIIDFGEYLDKLPI